MALLAMPIAVYPELGVPLHRPGSSAGQLRGGEFAHKASMLQKLWRGWREHGKR
jgi:hypothetical protein